MTSDKLNTRGADLALSIEKILTKLTICLNQETEAIIQNNRDAAHTLQDEKIRLMEQYRSMSENMARDPNSLESLDTSIRDHLKTIGAEFQTALNDNIAAIKGAHNAVSRLMDRIMTTARRTLMDGQQQYNASGTLSSGRSQSAHTMTTPTKINEEL